jgi:uncharacterized SAM-dependent methyltransferase
MTIIKLLTKRQEAELVTAIQGRAEIPLKFAYLGEGAYNWDRIARERSGEGGGINSAEGALLTKKVNDFLGAIDAKKGVNVIDIGCGNGVPVLPILEHLHAAKVSFTYVPLDISQEMDIASKTVIKRFPGTKCKPVQMDFELGQFSDITYDLKENGSANLMLFLGSTLGNHSDLSRVLTNFRDSMTSKDFLIIGIELTNLAKVSSIVPHYTNAAVKKLLLPIPTELGISSSSYIYEASWNEKYSQVECRIILKKDIKVKIANEHFTLGKNESILVARSIKFTEYTATKLFSDVGFRTELLTTAQDRGYLLTMIQPTRYSA